MTEEADHFKDDLWAFVPLGKARYPVSYCPIRPAQLSNRNLKRTICRFRIGGPPKHY